jgi:hypothetical protein
MITRSVVTLALSLACACSGADRPPSPDEAMPVMEAVNIPVTEPCRPGELRACHRYYTEREGTITVPHCPLSYEQCDTDMTWGPCGEFSTAALAGTEVPP